MLARVLQASVDTPIQPFDRYLQVDENSSNSLESEESIEEDVQSPGSRSIDQHRDSSDRGDADVNLRGVCSDFVSKIKTKHGWETSILYSFTQSKFKDLFWSYRKSHTASRL